MNKNRLGYLVMLGIIPLLIAAGVVVLHDRKYQIISILLAFLACVPFFISFEMREPNVREMVVLAVMTALSVAGRFLFAMVPGFKPVTAIVVITAIHFGPQAGFLTGALSAVLSNIYFGQGPWTPFQMFVWGLLGLLAGLLAKHGWLQSRLALSLYGILAGAAFSLLMDVWTVLAMDGTFAPMRYLVAVSSSFFFMAIYAVSNVVFLLTLSEPIGEKLERIKIKYGLMDTD